MARIFITGSSDGLGQLAARALVAMNHHVVLHARNEKRAGEALKMVPGAEGVLTADLSNIEETMLLASNVNKLERFDAVIHNAGVYNASVKDIFNVNVLAPYILTCLIQKPSRLIYISSGMHFQGHASLDKLKTDIKGISYSDSKLFVLMLCMAAARKWPELFANAVDPGWVPTKMGGAGAPDSLQKGYETQVWLAQSNEEKAKVSGCYFFHQQVRPPHTAAGNVLIQEELLDLCKDITGISLE